MFVDLESELSLKKAFRLTLIGQFFSFFIPGGVGGDVVKALELSKDHVTSKADALSTVIGDRVLGLFSMIFISTLFLSIEYIVSPNPHLTHLIFISLTLFALATTGLLFAPFFLKRLNSLFGQTENKLMLKLNKLINSFNMTFLVFRNKKFLIKNIFVCFIVQLISILFMYSIVKALKVEPPPFFVFFSLCCFGFLASAIPLTPAGIGVGQAAFYFLFSTYKPEVGDAAVTAVSGLQLFQLFFALFGGLFFSIKNTPTKKAL